MGSKAKKISQSQYVAYHIKKCSIKVFDFIQTPDLLGWVETSNIEIVHISIICDLIGFAYHLTDTQDGLKC